MNKYNRDTKMLFCW